MPKRDLDAETSLKIIRLHISEYYKVLDPRLATYCIMNAEILSASLIELGLKPAIKRCQLIYTQGNRRVLIGFTGVVRDHQWDGHVAVRVGDYLLDPSIHAIKKYFGVEVPRMAGTHRLDFPSKLIATCPIEGGAQLLWAEPPLSRLSPPPSPPQHVVNRHARALASHVKVLLPARAEAA